MRRKPATGMAQGYRGLHPTCTHTHTHTHLSVADPLSAIACRGRHCFGSHAHLFRVSAAGPSPTPQNGPIRLCSSEAGAATCLQGGKVGPACACASSDPQGRLRSHVRHCRDLSVQAKYASRFTTGSGARVAHSFRETARRRQCPLECE